MKNLPYDPENLSVLIIDDHDPIRKLVKHVLIKMGFETIKECFNGVDGCAYVEENPVDLILCDIFSQKGSGFEVLKFVREKAIGSDIPIIIITGEATREDIVKAIDLGASDYVVKPFQAPELEKKITNILTAYHSPTPLLQTLRKGERHLLLKNYNEALAEFKKALAIDMKSARTLHDLAVAMYHLGQKEEAIKILQISSRKNPTYFKNFATLADFYLEKKDVQNAMRALANELAINPKQPDRQVLLGNMLLSECDAIGATFHFKEALKEDPKHLAALFGIGKAFSAAENLDKAIYYFKRIRRCYPDNTKSLELIISHCQQSGETQKAVMAIRDEISFHPERLDAYLLLAKFLSTRKETEPALEILNKALARNNKCLSVLKLKGNVLLDTNDFDSIITTFKEISEQEASLLSFLVLGETYLKLGKVPEAIKELKKALVLENKNPRVLLRLAEAYFKNDQRQKSYLMYLKVANHSKLPDKHKLIMQECHQFLRERLGGSRKIAS